jgi:carbon storage regulator
MLVLSRQRDETIMIGDDIEITVVDIRGDKVRVGITAPARIAVHRKEVYEAIRAENEQAARVRSGDVTELARGIGDASRARRAPGNGLSARVATPGSARSPAPGGPGAAKRAS